MYLESTFLSNAAIAIALGVFMVALVKRCRLIRSTQIFYDFSCHPVQLIAAFLVLIVLCFLPAIHQNPALNFLENEVAGLVFFAFGYWNSSREVGIWARLRTRFVLFAVVFGGGASASLLGLSGGPVALVWGAFVAKTYLDMESALVHQVLVDLDGLRSKLYSRSAVLRNLEHFELVDDKNSLAS